MPRRRKKPYKRIHSLAFDTEEDVALDTTGGERFEVFEICSSTYRYVVCLLAIAGALSLFMFFQCLVNAQMFSMSELKLVSMFAVGFIGTANIISGLLLLAME